jgi:dsRNA-specific ribonuclease
MPNDFPPIGTYDRINHILAEMSAKVSMLYSDQLSRFEASIADIEAKIARNEPQWELYSEISKTFLDKLTKLLGFEPPSGMEIAIKHASVPNLSKKQEENSNFYDARPDDPRGCGKQATYLVITTHLFRTGFFYNKSREHAAYVCNYLLRDEVIADAWTKLELGLLCTARHYQFQDKDLATAYYSILSILVKQRVSFQLIEKFVISTLTPFELLRFEYDMLVTRDSKTFLQEYMQGTFRRQPSYVIEGEEGRPAHSPMFWARVDVPGIGEVRQSGRSKQEATVLAAETSLSALRSSNIASFRKFESEKVEMTYGNVNCRSREWRPRYSQLKGARERYNQVNLPFLIKDVEIIECFSTLSSQHRNGACAHCNGVRSQIGSSLIGMVVNAYDIEIRHDWRARLLYDVLQKRFQTEHGEKLIFGNSIEHGERIGTDIIQSIVFTSFSHSPDRVINELTKLIGSSEITRLSLNEFDSTIVYVTLLQELTQSMPERTRPEYLVRYDLQQPHAPNHTCICNFGELSTTSVGTSVKRAKNRASFEMLRLLEKRRNE